MARDVEEWTGQESLYDSKVSENRNWQYYDEIHHEYIALYSEVFLAWGLNREGSLFNLWGSREGA